MIQCVCGDPDAPGPDWDEDEGDIQFENHTEVKLEDFKCVECGALIPAGQEHDYIWGVWEGDEREFRTCLPCARVRNDFCCDGYPIGDLWLTLREAFRDINGSDDLEWLVP
jgi:hypothetical protein